MRVPFCGRYNSSIAGNYHAWQYLFISAVKFTQKRSKTHDRASRSIQWETSNTEAQKAASKQLPGGGSSRLALCAEIACGEAGKQVALEKPGERPINTKWVSRPGPRYCRPPSQRAPASCVEASPQTDSKLVDEFCSTALACAGLGSGLGVGGHREPPRRAVGS